MFYHAQSAGYKEMLPGVHLKTLVFGERTHFTEVRFVKGATVPVHQHPQEQTGYLVKGSLRFDVDGEIIIAKSGDSWNLPAKYSAWCRSARRDGGDRGLLAGAGGLSGTDGLRVIRFSRRQIQ